MPKILALLCGLLLAAPAFAQPSLVKVATIAPQGSIYHRVLQEMGEAYRHASGPQARFVIYPNSIQGTEADTVRRMRVGQLDADFDHGALRTFLIGYEMSRPNAAADAEQRARAHFARAVELSGGRQAGPYVSLAESVCVEKRARREFEALLRQALQVDADARPEWRLANLVMQRRAHHLLERAGELFPE